MLSYRSISDQNDLIASLSFFGMNSNNRTNEPMRHDLAEIAKRLKVVAEPTRLRILAVLLSETKTVSELSILLEIHYGSVSHHLRALQKAGLLAANRCGKYTYYEINPQTKSRTKNAINLGSCVLEFKDEFRD